LKNLVKRLSDRHVTLEWTKEVVKKLAEDGYDPFFGARPLKRLIQTDIVNMLSKGILEGKIPPECTLELVLEKDAFQYHVKK
jgi:ATP-dependent Clp protease ATP-binding subunit ClpB